MISSAWRRYLILSQLDFFINQVNFVMGVRNMSESSYEDPIRKARRDQIKRNMMDFYKSHPCVDCGEKDPRVLDFDHLNNKRYNVSTLLNKEYSWDSILQEAAKCQVRCANCHRIKTAIKRNHYTNLLLEEFFDLKKENN
jgi:hypothetical protein